MAGQGSAKLASKHYLFPGDSNYVGDGSPIGLPFQVLAEEFVNWLGVRSFMMRSSMVELCSSKGITLSFAPVPPELRGFNCSFQYEKEIVISEEETVVFSDLHTLLHEFR